MSCVLVFAYNKKVFLLFSLLLLILTSFVWCYLFVEFLFGSFVLTFWTEVLFWNFVLKPWLEALNNYVIFILLLGEYLIETFFVLKYVAWYFYMWYIELVCLFEYWVWIFVPVIFHWACCQYRWFCVFAVLVIFVRLGILCTATWREYWKCKWIFQIYQSQQLEV